MPVPDRLYIHIKDENIYKELEQNEFFKGKSNKDLFLFAMAVGFKNKVRRPIESKKEFVREEYLKEKDLVLLYALAIFETGKIDVINNKAEVYKIAEEYAHGGIQLLIDKVRAPNLDFGKQLELELYDYYKK
ncbi:MAG: hypothetical protein QW738_05375 [Nitrososphaeria archaeon]